jgi:hypothetical protein
MTSPETINAGTEPKRVQKGGSTLWTCVRLQTLSAVTGHSNTALFPDGTKPHRPLPFERSFFTRWRVIICWPKDDVLTSSPLSYTLLVSFTLFSINFTAFFFFSSSHQSLLTNFSIYFRLFIFKFGLKRRMDLVFNAGLSLKLRFLFVAALFIINFHFPVSSTLTGL